jgi:8-oxo-dGTP pyrophosphatase MutT (NUDIX family)
MSRKKKRRKDKCPPRVDLRQAAALPFRRGKGGVEFCLVTVRRGTSWTMPKGNIERGEQGTDCAERETFEEAGLEGRLIDPQLCRYTDRKGKKSVEVTVWLLEVKKTRKKWPEKKVRTRRWVSPRKAIRLLARPHLVAPIVDAMRCLGEID